MSTKKKANRCTQVNGVAHQVDYQDLADGDCFIWEKQLWIKCDYNDQEATCLDDGTMATDMCGHMVIQAIDVKVTYTL